MTTKNCGQCCDLVKLLTEMVLRERSKNECEDLERKIINAELKKDHKLLEELLIEKQNLAVERYRKRNKIRL